jgi:hypothetical protein
MSMTTALYDAKCVWASLPDQSAVFQAQALAAQSSLQ